MYTRLPINKGIFADWEQNTEVTIDYSRKRAKALVYVLIASGILRERVWGRCHGNAGRARDAHPIGLQRLQQGVKLKAWKGVLHGAKVLRYGEGIRSKSSHLSGSMLSVLGPLSASLVQWLLHCPIPLQHHTAAAVLSSLHVAMDDITSAQDRR